MKRAVWIGVVAVIVAIVIWLARPHRDDASHGTRLAQARISSDQAVAPTRVDRAIPAWFAAIGIEPRRIAGRVTFAGAPVEGAVVALHSVLSGAGGASTQQRRTGADGTFDFGSQPVAVYDVTANAAGKAAAIVHVRLGDRTHRPPPDHLELRLRGCAASIAGIVLDAAGAGIPHATARIGGLVGAEADDKGAYELCLPPGESAIEYAADGYGAVVFTIEAHEALHQDVVLTPEATITGKVVRDDDGAPISGAYVSAYPGEWTRDRAGRSATLSDADGRFRIAHLTPGRFSVFGYADDLIAAAPVTAFAEVGAPHDIVIRLGRTGRISGTLVRAGVPIGGVDIAAIRTSPVGRSWAEVTQPDGSFVLRYVPPGELAFTAPPFAVRSPQTFHAEPGKDYTGVVIEAEPMGTIHGRVTHRGKPVEGAEVCCVHTLGGPTSTRSELDGHYEFTGVGAGTYSVGAQNDEVGAFTTPIRVPLADGEDRTLDLELDLAGAIAGEVVDEHGAPVKGVFVRWADAARNDTGSCITDARGHYRCGALAGGGKYQAGVYPTPAMQSKYPTADGAPYPTLEVKDGATILEGVRLTIQFRQVAISGHVVDQAGAPVVDARVRAAAAADTSGEAFNSWFKLPMAITDPDGAFTVNDLAQGTYVLQAHAPDGAEVVTGPITAGSKGVTVVVQRPSTIEGTLVGFPQPPFVNATPISEGLKLFPATVDGTTFRISGLRPGRYVVDAQTTFEGEAQTVDVAAGSSTKVVLTAHGRGRVEADVLEFRTHAPVRGLSCHAVMSADGWQGATSWDGAAAPQSDARGHVVFDPSPAGKITLACTAAFPLSPPSADLVVAPGTTVSAKLYVVELAGNHTATAGVQFDWRVAAPRIAQVAAGSGAATAGLMAGDLVVAVNGTPVDDLNGAGVWYLLDDHEVGATVSVTVLRGAERKTVSVKLQPRQ